MRPQGDARSEALRELWTQAGRSKVFINALDRIGEAIKYPFKSVGIPDHMIVDFARESRGLRFVSAGGDWKRKLSDQSLDEDDDMGEYEVLSDEELFEKVTAGSDHHARALVVVLQQEFYTEPEILKVFFSLGCSVPKLEGPT